MISGLTICMRVSKLALANTLSESSVLSLLTSHACSLTSPENYL